MTDVHINDTLDNSVCIVTVGVTVGVTVDITVGDVTAGICNVTEGQIKLEYVSVGVEVGDVTAGCVKTGDVTPRFCSVTEGST